MVPGSDNVSVLIEAEKKVVVPAKTWIKETKRTLQCMCVPHTGPSYCSTKEASRPRCHAADIRGRILHRQFSFHRSPSAMYTIMHMRRLTTGESWCCLWTYLTPSIRTSPWSSTKEAIITRCRPTSLCHVIEASLTDRFIIYSGHQGKWKS